MNTPKDPTGGCCPPPPCSPFVVHCKRSKHDVCIGRPSKWGNPFEIGKDGDRETVIRKYREWVVTQPHLMAALHELRGKVLGCWCAPQACHGDVLVSLANDQGEARAESATPIPHKLSKHMETSTHTAPPVVLDHLVSSSWAIRFLKECPTGYKEAIRRAGEPVEIYETDETGDVQWAITLEDGFWMDALPTKEEAESLVADMGWPIIGANVEVAHESGEKRS